MVASSGSSSSGGGCGSSSMHEPLVYLNGCLKNVTNDASNQRGLVKLGALQVLASLLTQLAAQVREERGGGGAQCSAAGTVKVWSEFPYLLPGRSRGRELVHPTLPLTHLFPMPPGGCPGFSIRAGAATRARGHGPRPLLFLLGQPGLPGCGTSDGRAPKPGGQPLSRGRLCLLGRAEGAASDGGRCCCFGVFRWRGPCIRGGGAQRRAHPQQAVAARGVSGVN